MKRLRILLLALLLCVLLSGCGIQRRFSHGDLLKTGLNYYRSLKTPEGPGKDLLNMSQYTIYGFPEIVGRTMGWGVYYNDRDDYNLGKIGEFSLVFWCYGVRDGRIVKERQKLNIHCLPAPLESTGWKIDKVRLEYLGPLTLWRQIGAMIGYGFLYGFALGIIMNILTLPLFAFGKEFGKQSRIVFIFLAGAAFGCYLSWVYFQSAIFTGLNIAGASIISLLLLVGVSEMNNKR